MEPQDIEKLIDEKIAKAVAFATKKYGDTPTDALQLVPKKYVTSVIAGISAGSPGGTSGNIQFNNGSGGFGGSSIFTLIPAVPEVLLQGANPIYEALGTTTAQVTAVTSSTIGALGYGNVVGGGNVGAFSYLKQVDSSVGTNQVYTFFTTTTTTNNTPKLIFEYQWPTTGPVPSTTAYIEAKINGRRTGGSGGSTGDAAMYVRRAGFSRAVGPGTVQVGATQDSFTVESSAAWDATIALSGISDIDVLVTGDTNNNITWDAEIKIILSQ